MDIVGAVEEATPVVAVGPPLLGAACEEDDESAMWA